MKKQDYELLVLCIFIVAGVMFLRESVISAPTNTFGGTDYHESMTFPKIIIELVIFLCVCLLIPNLYRRLKAHRISEGTSVGKKAKLSSDSIKVLFSIVLSCIYVLVWNLLGFILSSILFITAESWVLTEKRSVKIILILAVGTTLFFYAIFAFVFKVRFPGIIH